MVARPPVAIFARVSTSKQQNDRQVADLVAHAEKLHYEVVATFTETISGAKRLGQRPQLQELLALASAGTIKKVLVTEISRLGRRTVEVLQTVESLTDAGVSVHAQNYNLETLLPNGRRNPLASLLFTLLAEFAQLERETTVERINSGLADARRRGVPIGRPKTGPAQDREVLLAYPKVVKYLLAGYSIRETAKLAGVSNFTVQKVKRILARRKPEK
jgi:DNA invertase Pin-like site-specific DNA recombinase